MQCNSHMAFLFFFLLSLSVLPAQDAKLNSQLSLIPELLNEFDQSINSLEANMNASNQTITNLQKIVNSMQTTINLQQRQLQQASMNLANSEQTMQQRSQNYEVMLQSLEVSLTESLREKNDYKTELKIEKGKNKELIKAVWILGSILSLILAAFIAFIVVKIKTIGLPSLIGKIIGFFIKK